MFSVLQTVSFSLANSCESLQSQLEVAVEEAVMEAAVAVEEEVDYLLLLLHEGEAKLLEGRWRQSPEFSDL